MLLSPVFNENAFQDNAGNPLAGGLIFQYEAGSFSVLQSTYTDETGAVANANPIVLDSSGRLPGSIAIWLQPGQLYNLVLTAPDGVTVLKSFDDVSGVLVSTGGGGGGGTSIWVEQAATYLSPSSFLVVGNVTANYVPGNRVRAALAAGAFAYGTVQSSSFSSGNTTVILTSLTSPLNTTLTRGDYSLLVAQAITVDAAGVAYDGTFNYTNPLSIGFEVKDIRADLNAEIAQIDRLNTTWATSGAGVDTPFVITPTPAATAVSTDSTWSVRFAAAGEGNATLNVSGLGAKRLRSYSVSGTLVNAIIPAGLVSTVTYDVANDCYIVQNRIPQVLPLPPRGGQVFTSNGTWTCPASVTMAKVTCMGGGGGGGNDFGLPEGISAAAGGAGAISQSWLAVTAGTGYAVSVGSGGVGQAVGGPANAGGTSSFGITMASAGGGGGANGQIPGANSTSGVGFVYAGFGAPYGSYGQGGAPGTFVAPPAQGAQGFVIVEY